MKSKMVIRVQSRRAREAGLLEAKAKPDSPGKKVWAEADDSTARGQFIFMIFPIPFKPVEL